MPLKNNAIKMDVRGDFLGSLCRFYPHSTTTTSSKLLTFNTPFGRYKFNRLAFGILSSPEVFQRAMS